MSKVVLIVDDSIVSRMMLKEIVKSMQESGVEIARIGEGDEFRFQEKNVKDRNC